MNHERVIIKEFDRKMNQEEEETDVEDDWPENWDEDEPEVDW
jgi:hypothetical protein